ncbi:MAG: response regulator transcription factor [Cyanobacteria bacterium REEB67]|nr:response regulator transcription factor [Cyanobacteria bacterium REEB67]
MAEADKPKTQVETGRGGPGAHDPTAIGGDDDGSFEYALVGSKLNQIENKPRAVICEPDYLVRHGLIARLRYTVRVVGETAEGAEAVRILHSTTPDIVLFNVQVGMKYALEVCNLFAGQVKILIVTDSYNATRYARQLQRAGIQGLCLHSCNDARLIESVGWTLAGEQFIDSNLRPWLEQRLIRDASSDALDERELEVLLRLCQQDEDIAEELDLEPAQVEKLTAAILRKMRVARNTAAVVKAMQLGYLMLPKMPVVGENGKSDEQTLAEEMALRAIGESARAD